MLNRYHSCDRISDYCDFATWMIGIDCFISVCCQHQQLSSEESALTSLGCMSVSEQRPAHDNLQQCNGEGRENQQVCAGIVFRCGS